MKNESVINALTNEAATLRVRLAIFTAAESALRQHIGKPIGKRLAACAEAMIPAQYSRQVYTVGGPSDFRYLHIRIDGQLEKFWLGYCAALVPADACENARSAKESITEQLAQVENLLADTASLETSAENLRNALASLSAAIETAKTAKSALPHSAAEEVLKEFPVIFSLTSRI